MHRRLLVVSAALMCALVVFVAWVLCDLHDRSLPQELHPSVVVTVTLPDGMDDADTLRQLTELNRKLGLGLVKIVPDMERNTDAQVFVPLSGTTLQGLDAGAAIRRFGRIPDGRIADASRLASASAGGQYLICGRWNGSAHRGLDTWATDAGMRLDYGNDDLMGDLRMLLGQSSFRVAVGAAVALMAVLVLFWLSFKTRSD